MARVEPDVLRALEAHMADLLPGCEVVDRNLFVEDGPEVHLVCLDPAGRLFLVSFVEGGAQETVMLALDTLAFVRRHAGPLARHVGPEADARQVPCVVLVAEHFADRACMRLASIVADPGRLLMLYELRVMESERGGQTAWFAPVPGLNRAQPGAASVASFLEELSAEGRSATERFLDALENVDPEMHVEARRDRLTWHLGTSEIGTLTARGKTLHFKAPGGVTRRMLLEEDARSALDDVMARVVDALSAEDDPDLPAGPPPPIRREEPLLTPEELEAFRD